MALSVSRIFRILFRNGPMFGFTMGRLTRYPDGSECDRIFSSVRQCIPVSGSIWRLLTPSTNTRRLISVHCSISLYTLSPPAQTCSWRPTRTAILQTPKPGGYLGAALFIRPPTRRTFGPTSATGRLQVGSLNRAGRGESLRRSAY
jgi:hypothetical protein